MAFIIPGKNVKYMYMIKQNLKINLEIFDQRPTFLD